MYVDRPCSRPDIGHVHVGVKAFLTSRQGTSHVRGLYLDGCPSGFSSVYVNTLQTSKKNIYKI